MLLNWRELLRSLPLASSADSVGLVDLARIIRLLQVVDDNGSIRLRMKHASLVAMTGQSVLLLHDFVSRELALVVFVPTALSVPRSGALLALL